MAVLYTQHYVQFFDDNGNPLSGGKLYTYDAGTTTPKTTWTTSAETTPNANPVVLDSAGRATVFLNGSYRFDLKTSADVLIRSTDNVTSFAALTSNIPNSQLAVMAANTIKGNNNGGTSVPIDLTVNQAATMLVANNSFTPFRNRLINGRMGIDQRNAGAAQTITAAAALAYTVDRWYAYCTGANVTGQRVAGTAPNDFNYRFTGAASVTKIGFAQRIEAASCQDLAGTTATLSVDLANSLLTTVTWTAWYANTIDTFGTLASPTRTLISTGNFTVTSTLTRYSTNITVPGAATTGIEVEFSVAAQTSGTFTIGRAQLEAGAVATPFEHNDFAINLLRCQRYCLSSGAGQYFGQANSVSATGLTIYIPTPVSMRSLPSVTGFSGTSTFGLDGIGNFTSTTAPTVSGIGANILVLGQTGYTGLTTGRPGSFIHSVPLIMSAEL